MGGVEMGRWLGTVGSVGNDLGTEGSIANGSSPPELEEAMGAGGGRVGGVIGNAMPASPLGADGGAAPGGRGMARSGKLPWGIVAEGRGGGREGTPPSMDVGRGGSDMPIVTPFH